MSQIQTLATRMSVDEVLHALRLHGLEAQQARGRRLLLPVSAECIPEPVDILCAAGSLNTLEAWGFRMEGDSGFLTLVCGEFDQKILDETLLIPARKRVASQRAVKALAEIQAESAELHEDQRPRVVIREDT